MFSPPSMPPPQPCRPGYQRQLNTMTGHWVCAPPGSYPHYVADSDRWVMVPATWILATDPTTGKLKYVPPRT